MKLIDGAVFGSEKADVVLCLAPRWGGRWSIIIRGQRMAMGWCSYKGFGKILDAANDLSLLLATEPGYGHEADALRSIVKIARTEGWET